MNFSSVLLQLPAMEGNKWSGPLMMVALVVVFYFFMIRPQQKKQKEIAKMRASLGVGDRVLISGGIYGKIKEVNETDFLVEIADNVKVKVDKASVFAVADETKTSK